MKDKTKSENNIRFVKGENYPIKEEAEVKLITANNKIFIKESLRKQTNLRGLIKLKDNRMLNKETGEIKQFTNNIYKTKKSIKNNMNNLKNLINLYFDFENDSIIFLTVTCKENLKDIETIRKYTTQFIKKIKRKYSKYDFMYVYKLERQERGSWHTHFLIKDTKNKRMFLPYEEINKIWGKR